MLGALPSSSARPDSHAWQMGKAILSAAVLRHHTVAQLPIYLLHTFRHCGDIHTIAFFDAFMLM